jgi:hypothetical protein
MLKYGADETFGSTGGDPGKKDGVKLRSEVERAKNQRLTLAFSS